jgi:cardiolipin synthase
MDSFGLATAAGVVVTVLDVAVIARAVARGHGVEGTIAWILLIVAFPAIGAVAYLMLASPSVKRTTRRKRTRTAYVRGAFAAVTRDRHGAETLPPAISPGAAAMLRLATAATGLAATRGNRVEILAESERATRATESAVEGARQTIWAEYYIIRNDATGYRFLDALIAKARQGVDVRLLYDAMGTPWLDRKRLAALRGAGGRVESFLPPNPLRRRWSVHLRNHRKIIVVDGEIGFTGGMNVGDEYSGRLLRSGGTHFRDTHLEVRGPAVGDLAQTFAEDWSFASGEALAPSAPPPPKTGGTATVAVVPSGPDQEQNASGLVYFSGLATARRRIDLTSPYFAPDEPTMRALVTAALRGVELRLLLPGRSDVPIVSRAARTTYGELLRAGVRIFEYQGALLHAKTLAVDGEWGVVGSANIDMRSFRLNFELCALVADAHFAVALEARFAADLEQSREVTLRHVAGRGFPERLVDGAARLLSPLL